MIKLLKNFDSFSIPFFINTSSGKTHFKSIIGGILTIIIYSIGLTYLIYMLVIWQTNGILPKISSKLQTKDIFQMKLDRDFLTFGLFNSNMDEIDPFREQENIITPLLLKVNGKKVQKHIPMFSKINNLEQRPIVTLGEQEIIQYSTNTNYTYAKDNILFILLVPCQQKYLQGNQTCASEQTIQQYLSTMTRVIDINIRINQYNTETELFEEIIKTTFIVINRDYRLLSEILLDTTDQQVDKGWFFESNSYNEYINDYKVTSQIVNQQYSENYYGTDSIISIFMKINDLQTKQHVSYPKLGEILAQVGSLLSVLLSIQYVMFYINYQMLLEEELSHLMTQLYPKLNNYILIRNMFGKLVSVDPYVKNEKEFIEIYEFHKEKIKEKLKWTTIIQDIIKLQQCIQDESNSNNIQSPESEQELKQPDKIYPMNSKPSILNEEDNIQLIYKLTLG